MTSPLSSGRLGHALSNLLGHGPGGEFLGGPDNDLLLGTRRSDDLRGGPGSDALLGFRGDDVLQGGAGLDAAWGGAGDDAFVFAPGDLITSRSFLNGYLGQVDTVLDFHGAGTTGSGQQDVIRLEGFGAGTTLEFAGSGGPWSLAGLESDVQLYEVVDPTTEGADGFVLVDLASNRGNRLTAEDVVVVPDDGPGEPRITNLTEQGNEASVDPSISADGSRVAFVSNATNLGEADVNGTIPDVFVTDRATGEALNVTNRANGDSANPSLSGDGSTVAFDSSATNLAGGEADANGATRDIFLQEIALFETTNITEGANGDSFDPTLSADASRVVFGSFATNLVEVGSDDSNGQLDIFLYDATTGETIGITQGGDDYSTRPTLSADGSTVAFESASINLIDGEADLNGDLEDIFLFDVASGQTTNLTQGSNGRNSAASLSGDGSVVAFSSAATNLVEGEADANGDVEDIFVLDAATGETINVTAGADGSSFDASLSADGSQVTFTSRATNLVEGETDANGATPDVFVYDVATGETVNLTQGGNVDSYDPSFSADGATVTFWSYASNLVEGETDANGNIPDVFVLDLV